MAKGFLDLFIMHEERFETEVIERFREHLTASIENESRTLSEEESRVEAEQFEDQYDHEA